MANAVGDTKRYDSSSGGGGSLKGVAQALHRPLPDPGVIETLARQNKPEGFMCSSCAWGKPAHPHAFEFCENGAKSTIWELTRDRCGPGFFQDHTVEELRSWSDYDLEMVGRLTSPLRYDAPTDRYLACDWEEAFADIGTQLNALYPKSVV